MCLNYWKMILRLFCRSLEFEMFFLCCYSICDIFIVYYFYGFYYIIKKFGEVLVFKGVLKESGKDILSILYLWLSVFWLFFCKGKFFYIFWLVWDKGLEEVSFFYMRF